MPKISMILNEAKKLNLSVPTLTAMQSIPACSLPQFPHHHKYWSKSPGCVNQDYVQNQAQAIIGINTPVQKAFSLWVLPIGGAVADSFGRRPVLLAYVLMCISACIIYLVDTRLCHIWGNVMVVVAGAMICPCWEPKGAILSACVADCVGSNTKQKSRGMSVIYICMQVGSLIGFGISFVCLSRHYEYYTIMWLIYALIAVGILIFVQLAVPETLPADLRARFNAYAFNIFSSQYEAMRVLLRDRLLTWLMINSFLVWLHFVGFITLGYTYMIGLGFSAQEAIVPAIVNAVFQILNASTMAKFGSNIGIMNTYAIGNAFFLFAYILMGPLVNAIGHAAPYIAFACFGMGFSMMIPSVLTTISDRVEEEHQAKSQSAMSWTNSIGALVAPLIWNLVLFDSTAEGFGKFLPVYVSMFVAIVCTLIGIMMAWKVHVWPKAKEISMDSARLPLKAHKNGARSYA